MVFIHISLQWASQNKTFLSELARESSGILLPTDLPLSHTTLAPTPSLAMNGPCKKRNWTHFSLFPCGLSFSETRNRKKKRRTAGSLLSHSQWLMLSFCSKLEICYDALSQLVLPLFSIFFPFLYPLSNFEGGCYCGIFIKPAIPPKLPAGINCSYLNFMQKIGHDKWKRIKGSVGNGEGWNNIHARLASQRVGLASSVRAIEYVLVQRRLGGGGGDRKSVREKKWDHFFWVSVANI